MNTVWVGKRKKKKRMEERGGNAEGWHAEKELEEIGRREEDGLRSRLRVLSDDVYPAGELTADRALCGKDRQEVCGEEEKENEENPRQPDGATGQETTSSVLRCAFAGVKKRN